ncbi:MAG: DUF5659 domain-containing protein [candidate division WOR-3 bacterium]
MKKENNKRIKIKSIFFASYLTYRGIQLLDIEFDLDGSAAFIFLDDEQIFKIQEEFFQNIELQKFLSCYKFLKQKMFQKNRKRREKMAEEKICTCYKDGVTLVEEIYNPALDPPFQFAYFLKPTDTLPFIDPTYRSIENGEVIRPLIDENIRKGIVSLPTMAEEYGTEEELVKEIENFLDKYLEIDEIFKKITTYYIFLTWCYDRFDVLPYLRVIGEPGSGKTRFLQTVGSICYKPIFASGAITAAPIYRLIETYGGTLILDEADFKHSNGYEEIVKILNCGYIRGIPVLRCEKNKDDFSVTGYDCFGPKIIATRSYFDDIALESRCITYHIKCRRRNIPLHLPPEFKEETQTLRNKLLLWRLRNFHTVKLKEDLMVPCVQDRINQIFLPLLSIIKDPEVIDDIQMFMVQYDKELLTSKKMSTEAELVMVLCECLEVRNTNPTVKEIAERYNNKFASSEKEKLTAKKVGHILRKIGLQPKQRSDGYFAVILNEEEMEELKMRYYGRTSDF